MLATTVLVRLGWVLGYTAVERRVAARRGRPADPVAWPCGLTMGWCGMRGIVTLATALALPNDFPHRDLLLFTAFAVVLGTLVVQGLTLRPLLAHLALKDDGVVDREVRLARASLAEAAIDMMTGDDGPEAVSLRRECEERRRAAADATDGDGRVVPAALVLRGRTLARCRERLLRLRYDGAIGDDAFHRIEEEIDHADLAAAAGGNAV